MGRVVLLGWVMDILTSYLYEVHGFILPFIAATMICLTTGLIPLL